MATKKIVKKKIVEPKMEIYYSVNKGKYILLMDNGDIHYHTPMAASKINKKKTKEAAVVIEVFDPKVANRQIIHDEQLYFNHYMPSKYRVNVTKEQTDIPESVNTLLNHVFRAEDEQMKEVYLDILALHFMKALGIHIGWMFIGMEGSGKGTFTGLITKLFGDSNTALLKLNAFTGDKVKGAPESLIGICDESIDHKKGAEVIENLKTIIANEDYTSRALYSDGKKVKNYTMFHFTANTFNVALSTNDRRFNLVNTDKKLSDTVENISDFRKELYSDEVLQQFANHLANRKVNKESLTKVFKTDFKAEHVTNNLTYTARAANVILNGDIKHLGDLIDAESHLNNSLVQLRDAGFVSNTAVEQIVEAINKEFDLEIKVGLVRKNIALTWKRAPKKRNGKTYKGFITNVENDETYLDFEDENASLELLKNITSDEIINNEFNKKGNPG